MLEWNPRLGYNIQLINDLVNDYSEGTGLMMDTKGIDKYTSRDFDEVCFKHATN